MTTAERREARRQLRPFIWGVYFPMIALAVVLFVGTRPAERVTITLDADRTADVNWLEVAALASEMISGDTCVRAEIVPPADLVCHEWRAAR